jgi:hypothetical protein
MQIVNQNAKIVIRPPVASMNKVRLPQEKLILFDGSVAFLVAGSISSFHLSAAVWLISKGARKIALCLCRSQAYKETLNTMAHWKKRSVSASLHACNITNEEAMDALLSELRVKGPIRGIIHSAMLLDDTLISNLTHEQNSPVVNVEVRGDDRLDGLTRNGLFAALHAFLLYHGHARQTSSGQ